MSKQSEGDSSLDTISGNAKSAWTGQIFDINKLNFDAVGKGKCPGQATMIKLSCNILWPGQTQIGCGSDGWVTGDLKEKGGFVGLSLTSNTINTLAHGTVGPLLIVHLATIMWGQCFNCSVNVVIQRSNDFP